MSSRNSSHLLLLLYTDRSDPVARGILEHHPVRLDREVVALSLVELLNDVTPGASWTWRGRSIDPARTAVVNRLTLPPAEPGGPLASYAAQRRFWIWLSDALGRFNYVSAPPTATSPIGGYGSLLDQWLDLPELFAGLRVPMFRRPWSDDALTGDVYGVDPWTLYSLGTRLSTGAASATLAYVRPRGHLVHVAQVGETILVANAPPTMSRAQQATLVDFANAMGLRSTTRILEHAFFVGDDTPVFYSTCPTPVITGSLPDYPAFLVEGLWHDIDRRRRHAAA